MLCVSLDVSSTEDCSILISNTSDYMQGLGPEGCAEGKDKITSQADRQGNL
jgi:hypothetical protein